MKLGSGDDALYRYDRHAYVCECECMGSITRILDNEEVEVMLKCIVRYGEVWVIS